MALNLDVTYQTVILYTTDKVQDPQPQHFTYYLDFTYEQLLDSACGNLKLPKNIDYQILYRNSQGQVNWLIKGQTLRDIGAVNGDMIHVLPSESQSRPQPNVKQVYEFQQNEDYDEATLIGENGEIYRFDAEPAESARKKHFNDIDSVQFGHESSSDKPQPLAMSQIDILLSQPRDPKRVAAIHKQGAERGLVDEQFQWALCLQEGRGCNKDLAEAAKYYKLAAVAGNPKAMFNYGMMLREGEGVEQDMSQALTYFKRAADLGHPTAQYTYGAMLMKGEGCKRNPGKAREYIEAAAEQGEEQANEFLSHFVEQRTVKKEHKHKKHHHKNE
ncbi:sel1 repeat family protein [Histomonas meleagridis]|uniref:sel1 repeat family protein n=1 Tax=Histomonas meleagridis TaxID=135588 RepID=UPI0035596B92|nr:sel1 repeat family protein [Histomonas meleagridis]KAH0804365.1 sel1 repeat family protein [Histomonas meleagridis]